MGCRRSVRPPQDGGALSRTAGFVPITTVDDRVRGLVQDLMDTVDAEGRAGPAANQIGVGMGGGGRRARRLRHRRWPRAGPGAARRRRSGSPGRCAGENSPRWTTTTLPGPTVPPGPHQCTEMSATCLSPPAHRSSSGLSPMVSVQVKDTFRGCFPVGLDRRNTNVRTTLDWLRYILAGGARPPVVPPSAAGVEPDTIPVSSAGFDQATGAVRHTVSHRPAKVAAIDVAALVARHREGYTLRQLAGEFGAHRTTIARLLREAGVQTDRFAVPQATVEEACRLYATGLSCADVARRLGKTPSAVHGVLRRSGIQMRPVDGRASGRPG